MGAKTHIAWTDSTVNFWWGCTKVGPGCEHCFADEIDKRFGESHWGAGAPRKKIKSAVTEIRKLNQNGVKFLEENGHKRRVFPGSMCDLFDNEVEFDWRAEAFREIGCCTDLEFQIVTKRITNVPKLAPIGWQGNWPRHVGLMVTVCTQDEANRDIPRLIVVKEKYHIPWIGLSVEPMLEPISLGPWAVYGWKGIDWVICGGESGDQRRPFKIEWADDLRAQCERMEVAYFFKQDSARFSGERGRAGDLLWGTRQFPIATYPKAA